MAYFVATKNGEYTEKFCFESQEEREKFIEVAKKLNPNIEILLIDEESSSNRTEFYGFTA